MITHVVLRGLAGFISFYNFRVSVGLDSNGHSSFVDVARDLRFGATADHVETADRRLEHEFDHATDFNISQLSCYIDMSLSDHN